MVGIHRFPYNFHLFANEKLRVHMFLLTKKFSTVTLKFATPTHNHIGTKRIEDHGSVDMTISSGKTTKDTYA